MKLLEITEDKQIALNKEWIFLIPEFQALLKRDKGSEGDYRGQYKKHATKEFTYIYFICDFSSPLRDWQPEEKKREALYYAGLTEAQIDAEVEIAIAKYDEIQLKAARSLRTLKSVYKGMDEMDNYFEKVDFKLKDKMGKLLHDPQLFIKNTAALNKMYDEVRNFERRVEADLKAAGTTIRGKATLGDNEGKGERKWSESDIASGSAHTAEGITSTGTGSFNDILKAIQTTALREKAKERVEHGQAEPTLEEES